jgi:hypothetical protein
VVVRLVSACGVMGWRNHCGNDDTRMVIVWRGGMSEGATYEEEVEAWEMRY